MARARLAATGLALAATVAGFLGPRWWPASVLGNFRPQLAVGLGLEAVLAGSGRSWPLAGLAAGGAAVNAALVLPALSPRREPSANGPRLRVVGLNVLAANTRRREVAEWIRESGADVVVLPEAGGPWTGELLGAELPFAAVTAAGRRPGDGMVVLTREAPSSARVLAITPRPSIEVVVEVAGLPVRILGVHPHAPTTLRGARWQVQEIAAIAAWARGQAGPGVVVGDFNATPWFSGFRPLRAAGLTVSGSGWRPTWPARWWLTPLSLPLDHVMHTADLVAVHHTIGPALGSDHRAVDVTLALAGG